MKKLAPFIRNEIKHVGQIREAYLKRVTGAEVTFKYDWQFCSTCYYLYLDSHELEDCRKLEELGNPVVWINDKPYISDYHFDEEHKGVEKVLDAK